MAEPVREEEWIVDLRLAVERAVRLGFDGYCTDCEGPSKLYEGRCGCGSGRVATIRSLLALPSSEQGVG